MTQIVVSLNDAVSSAGTCHGLVVGEGSGAA